MTASPQSRGFRRPPALVLVPLALVVVALAAATLTFLPPPAEPQPSRGAAAPFPPPAAPILVNVHLAGSGPATVGLPTEVAAAAVGRTGIAGLELWVGGDRVELIETADPARPAATARWEWTPSEPGETIIVARAFDAQGRTAQSAPVRLTVSEHPPRSYLLEPVLSLAGETLDELVDRVGGDRSLAHYLHPELAEGPVPEGTLVDVPRFEGAVAPAVWAPPAGSVGATRERPRELIDAILAANLDAILPAGLATPVVDVQVAPDCTVTATASGGGSGAAGYAFLALPPIGETFFQLPPIAPDPNGSATTSFVALGGTNYLYAASYTEDASATSAIVPLAVPDDCTAAGWEGDARLDGGNLIIAGQADRAYLYLKVGDGSWQRLPSGAGSFVEPVDGAFEFGALLPAIAGKDLALEAWGWLDGSLVKLGQGSYTAPKQQLYGGGLVFGGGDPILGFGTTLDIVAIQGGGEILEQLAKHSSVDLPGPNSTSGQRHFKWSTTLPGVTHLVWQVLPYPLNPSSTTLAPPFLIDTGTIEVKGGSEGYFSLDLKPYLLDSDGSSGVWSTTLMTEQLISQVLLGNPYQAAPTGPPPEAILLPSELWWPKPSGGTTTQGPPQLGEATLQDLAFLAPLPTTLYVRVIPFFGAIPMPNASNVVSFDVVEPSDPVYIDTSPPPTPPTYPDAYKLVKAAFFGPTGSNQAYARCVLVVKGGKTVYDPIYTLFGGSNWNNGTTHCAPPPDDDDGWSLSDAFDSFTSWVGKVWDFVAEGYVWMQDKVVQAVLAVVPCEQFTSKDTCEKIAHTALQAALASFGLPPEIPNWESTVAAAKGDLKTFILENAEALPGIGDACAAAAIANQASSSVPTCEQVVDKAVNAAIEQVVKERSSAAAKSAGVLVPPGITVEPDPRSMAQPPHFEVTLQRTNLPLPADAVCTLYGSMTSVVEDWTWNEYQWINGNPKVVTKGPAQVNGEPFMAKKQVVAPLAPGQTVTYELWLTKSIVWFEPDGWNDHYAEQYYEWNGQHNRVWVLLQKGATVTGKLSSNCSPGGQSIQVLTGSAYS